ncbi:MAG TPA: nuclear transport factor 2 family protein [Thermoanaerobaculia bacterium]|nr:nuclear transport factor 2 family protein [Thermoanaerobaculia bacterium]
MSRSKLRSMIGSTMSATMALIFGMAAAGAGEANGASAQTLPEDQAAAIRRGVQATLDAYREHAAAGRWEELMRLYADEPRFRWVASGIVEARSVDQIRKYFAALPPGTRVENTYQDTEITPLAPGVAMVTTLFQTRLVDPQGGGGFAFGGALTMTLIERPDGWKILNGHSSSPVRRERNGARGTSSP